MKNSILLKKYYFLIYSTVSPLPLFNTKHIQKYIPLIKIISIVFISSIVVKAQESIGSFSVIENRTNGVPTTSSTSKFDLYTDRIVIFDKKVVEFPLTDFRKVVSDNKQAVFTFNFNYASCMLEIYDGQEYNLTIVTKKKVETFKGYGSGFNASINQIKEEEQILDFTPITPLVGEPEPSPQPEKVEAANLNDIFSKGKAVYSPIIIKESEYSEEERKLLNLGYNFLPGANLTLMRNVEREKENEKMKTVALAIIGLIIIGVVIFIFNQNKESLGKADSKIKSIDENELKANLNTNNLNNSCIAEIDDNTLKQKLGL